MKFEEFLAEFGLASADLGAIAQLGRRFFLTRPEHAELIAKHKKDLFGAGVYLGEEKQRFEPSPALIEHIAAKTEKHKAVVDEKAAWLFVCGRDILDDGIKDRSEPTKAGYLLVQNERGENLGYGVVPAASGMTRARQRSRMRGVAVKNLLDRGFFLRRERLA